MIFGVIAEPGHGAIGRAVVHKNDFVPFRRVRGDAFDAALRVFKLVPRQDDDGSQTGAIRFLRQGVLPRGGHRQRGRNVGRRDDLACRRAEDLFVEFGVVCRVLIHCFHLELAHAFADGLNQIRCLAKFAELCRHGLPRGRREQKTSFAFHDPFGNRADRRGQNGNSQRLRFAQRKTECFVKERRY